MPDELTVSLENPPVSTNEYLSADYIELLCITSMDGIVSKEQVAARIYKLDDIDTDFEELASEAALEESELLHWGESADYLPEPKYHLSEKRARQADDWFDQLVFREGTYDEFYPFTLSDDQASLIQKSEITIKHKLYIYLLMASNLRYFSKTVSNRLANYFEIVSVLALKQYLSPKSEVYMFGNNPLNNGRYSGTLWERITQFSKDIGDKPRHAKSSYPSNRRGERGLDLVGWMPFSDKGEGLLVVTGQSACSNDDWEDKQLTSHAARWKTHINFTVAPVNTVFIPHSFRQSNGEWYDVTRINDTILFDRVRLVQLLTDIYYTLEQELPFDLVQQILELEESIV